MSVASQSGTCKRIEMEDEDDDPEDERGLTIAVVVGDITLHYVNGLLVKVT